jgi:hypothetical protein
MKSTFIIVADRGNLKAFRVEKVPNGRPPRLHLVQAFTVTEAHMKITEMNTDIAGSFPVSSAGASQGRHQNALAEQHIDIEIDRRIVRQLADHIDSILKHEQPGAWSFAAPAAINRAILAEIDQTLAKSLTDNIQADLVKIAPGGILEHFEAARAA